MPLTSAPTSFAPIAEELKREGNTLRLTVGYDVPYDTIIEPVKYLDYIFTRNEDGNYYLTSLVTSQKKVETESDESQATSEAVMPDNQALLEDTGDGILTETGNASQSVQQTPPEIQQQQSEQTDTQTESSDSLSSAQTSQTVAESDVLPEDDAA